MYGCLLVASVVVLLLPAVQQHAVAEELGERETIIISRSDHIGDVTFDGRWTTTLEWKASALHTIGEETYIRSAHHGDFMYILIDVLDDRTFDRNSDRATVCLDLENTKSQVPDGDDYCFVTTAGSPNVKTLRGGSPLAGKDHFKRIDNPRGLVGVGALSDENNRYTHIPHLGYEFRIPLDFVGRSDNYGFFAHIYDHSSGGHNITFPEGLEMDDGVRSIPPPRQWGDMVSPDKSLPEFGPAYVLLSLALIPIALMGRLFGRNAAVLGGLR